MAQLDAQSDAQMNAAQTLILARMDRAARKTVLWGADTNRIV